MGDSGEREEFRRPRRRSVILTLQMQVDGRADGRGRGVPFPSCELRQAGRTDRRTDRQLHRERLVGEGRRGIQSLESYAHYDDWFVTSGRLQKTPKFIRIASSECDRLSVSRRLHISTYLPPPRSRTHSRNGQREGPPATTRRQRQENTFTENKIQWRERKEGIRAAKWDGKSRRTALLGRRTSKTSAEWSERHTCSPLFLHADGTRFQL